MGEYKTPGVYTEEIVKGPSPVEGISLSTAGMIGVTEWGPDDEAKPVTSFEEYKRMFGGFLDLSLGEYGYLTYAVKGFFENGGQTVYIKRIIGPNASKASLCPANAFITKLLKNLTEDDKKPGYKTIGVESLRGICRGSQVTFEEYSPKSNPPYIYRKTVTVNEYNTSLKTISFWSDGLPNKYSKLGCRITVGTEAPAEIPEFKFQAKYCGESGKKISVSIKSASAKEQDMTSVNGTDCVIALVKAVTGMEMAVKLDPAAAGDKNIIIVKSAMMLQENDRIIIENSNAPAGVPKSVSFIITDINTVTNGFELVLDNDVPFTCDLPETSDAPTFKLLPRLMLKSSKLSEPVGPSKDTIKIVDNIYLDNPAGSPKYILIKKGQDIERLRYGQYTQPKDGNPGEVKLDAGVFTQNGYDTNCTVTPWIGTARLFLDDVTPFHNNDLIKLVKTGGTEEEAIITNLNNDSIDIEILNYLGLRQEFDEKDNIRLERSNAAARNGDTAFKIASNLGIYENALIELDNGFIKERFVIDSITLDPADGLYQVKLPQGLNNMYCKGSIMKVLESDVEITFEPEKGTLLEEKFEGLSINPDAPNFMADIINSKSELLSVDDSSFIMAGISNIAMPNGGTANLAGGDSGGSSITAREISRYVLGESKGEGLKALEDIEEISLVAAPGITNVDIQKGLIDHCERMGYRFAILDAPNSKEIKSVMDFKTKELNSASSYGALYYPWARITNPLDGKSIDIPPSGHIAGVFARTDTLKGVHKSPANEEFKGVSKMSVPVNRVEHGNLNDARINVIKSFPGRGILVFGARTLAGQDNVLWKYISVRRLFLYIRKSIHLAAEGFVYDPNNERLWARVKMTITEFLLSVWNDGALMGSKPEQAFYVKCDRSIMTQNDIDNGKLIVEVGVAPAKPAEFVVLRFYQMLS